MKQKWDNYVILVFCHKKRSTDVRIIILKTDSCISFFWELSRHFVQSLATFAIKTSLTTITTFKMKYKKIIHISRFRKNLPELLDKYVK